MNCQDAKKHCHPYLDKQLEAGQAREVEQHLANCACCAQTYKSQRSFHKLLKHVVCEGEGCKAPGNLKSRILSALDEPKNFAAPIRQLPPPYSPPHVQRGLAFAASFMFGLSGLFMYGSTCMSRQCPLVRAAQHEHDNIVAGTRLPLLRSENLAELTRVASQHLRNFPGIPNLSGCNLKAETCGLIKPEGLPEGIFVEYATCECGGDAVTLMVINTPVMPGGEPVEKFIAANHANHNVISWRATSGKSDLLYILVTKRPFENALQVAEVASR